MKNVEQLVKNILQTTNETKNKITYDIIEGIDNRLSQRGTITPKQGVWLLNKIFREDMHLPADYITKVENGGIAEQQEAYTTIKTALDDGKMPVDINKKAKAEMPSAKPIKPALEIINDLKDKFAEQRKLNESVQKVSGISIAARRGIVETAIRIMIEDGINLPNHIRDDYLK